MIAGLFSKDLRGVASQSFREGSAELYVDGNRTFAVQYKTHNTGATVGAQNVKVEVIRVA